MTPLLPMRLQGKSVSWEQAQACLRRLESDFRKRQVGELRARVKAAEREGRVEEALSWMAELSRLERESRGDLRRMTVVH